MVGHYKYLSFHRYEGWERVGLLGSGVEQGVGIKERKRKEGRG
jgi:hypothetical protein